MSTKSAQKAAIRTALLQTRGQLDLTSRAEKNQAILTRMKTVPEIIAAKAVFSFISYGSEVDTRQLLDWFEQRDVCLAVPKLTDPDKMVAIPFRGWPDIEIGSAGIPAPSGTDELSVDIDVCITPGVGFTIAGHRLGYGLGYYDKWFAHHKVGLKVAPCYECQLLDELPADEYDVPVNMLVTEDRIIRV